MARNKHFDDIQRAISNACSRPYYLGAEQTQDANQNETIAAAADEIYADKSSLVGSIGVTAASFGFVELMKKLGVERRSYTSGEHKSFLDPFAPQREDEKVFWEGVLSTTRAKY